MAHRRDGFDRPHIWDYLMDWVYGLWITFRPGDERPPSVADRDKTLSL
jgi:hypothetical protein